MSDQVRSVISRILCVPVDQIRLDSSPSTTARWDSIKHVEIVLALEQEFGVRVDMLSYNEHTTVSDLAQSIGQKLARQ